MGAIPSSPIGGGSNVNNVAGNQPAGAGQTKTVQGAVDKSPASDIPTDTVSIGGKGEFKLPDESKKAITDFLKQNHPGADFSNYTDQQLADLFKSDILQKFGSMSKAGETMPMQQGSAPAGSTGNASNANSSAPASSAKETPDTSEADREKEAEEIKDAISDGKGVDKLEEKIKEAEGEKTKVVDEKGEVNKQKDAAIKEFATKSGIKEEDAKQYLKLKEDIDNQGKIEKEQTTLAGKLDTEISEKGKEIEKAEGNFKELDKKIDGLDPKKDESKIAELKKEKTELRDTTIPKLKKEQEGLQKKQETARKNAEKAKVAITETDGKLKKLTEDLKLTEQQIKDLEKLKTDHSDKIVKLDAKIRELDQKIDSYKETKEKLKEEEKENKEKETEKKNSDTLKLFENLFERIKAMFPNNQALAGGTAGQAGQQGMDANAMMNMQRQMQANMMGSYMQGMLTQQGNTMMAQTAGFLQGSMTSGINTGGPFAFGGMNGMSGIGTNPWANMMTGGIGTSMPMTTSVITNKPTLSIGTSPFGGTSFGVTIPFGK